MKSGFKIALVSFIIYLLTLSRGVNFGDSGELITASYLNGVAHSTGYPLYVMLGHIFSKIPLGSIAFRLNLMSAVFAALAIFFFHEFVSKKVGGKEAFYASVFLGFNNIVWSQAVIAEVYTLMVFLISLMLYLSLFAKDKKAIYLISFVAGLSLGNHVIILVVFPVIYFLVKDRRLLCQGIIFFCLGMLIYLHLPLSSFNQPVLNYGDMRNPLTFFNHVTAREYAGRNSYGLNTLLMPVSALIVLLSAFSVFSGFIVFSLDKKKWIKVAAVVIISNIAFAMAISAVTTPVHFLPSIVFISILLGIGYQNLAKKLPLVGILIFLFPVATFLLSPEVNMSNSSAVPYIDYIKDRIEPDSVFIARSDEDFFPLLYGAVVENRFPGMTLGYHKSISKVPEPKTLDDAINANMKVYAFILENTKNVYTTLAEHTENYDAESFPLKKFEYDEVLDILENGLDEEDYLFYKKL